MRNDRWQSWAHPEPILPESPIVVATPRQVLTGELVGHSDLTVICAGCHATVRAGADVVVYAYRCADAFRWDVARCYCGACAPHIGAPTLGTTEVLAGAVVDVRSVPDGQGRWCCLGDVAITAFSPPTEGTEP